MTTLQQVQLGVLGPLQVRQYGLPVAIPGAKPRAVLTMLGLHGGSVVSADTLAELLWGDDPPRTAAKALQTHISSLRRTLGDGFVVTEGTGWSLSATEIDAARYKLAARLGRDALAAGDAIQAVAHFDEALSLWRGIPELPDCPRGSSEKTRWIEGHAALVEDRADALLTMGRAAEIIGELEAAIADAPLRERRWGQLMLALYRAGRQGEALGAYQRARSLLVEELGVEPGPDLRRLEAAVVAQDSMLELPVSQQRSTVTRAVTFLLTDIEGSTAAWESDADAMAVALARHDEIVEQVVTSRAGRLVKTRGEGDATFSVFDRPSAAAAAAIELQEAIFREPWPLREPMRIRVALHTGEVELRDGDYFGRAVNRAARLRSLAAGGQILCSGATAELVIDSLPGDVVLVDRGMRQLRNLARPEHVFELRMETAAESLAATTDVAMERPGLPGVLAGPGPFVGRGRELAQLLSAWQATLAAGTRAVLIAGEPGVGKTRLAGEWSRQVYQEGAVVLYGRCDEDLGAPYQPFAEALRSLVPCLGTDRLRALRGVEALLPLVPGLADALSDLAAPPRADPDTERYALFDAVVAILGIASASAPVVLILDDLHWAAKPTLLLLRHLLRFGEHARVHIVGTYRSTDLDRAHPLAAMLADLHRDGSAVRLQLGGLDQEDVTAYVAEAGYDDEELARALAAVTGGNPFFLIEALRHVDESGGHWDPNTLPQGVREAVSRRLSRLPTETNKALAAAAVVGSRFALALVERVAGEDLVDAFDEACKAGIVIEEPGGFYRFNHAIVRQSLLAELASVRRMRLHQRIAATLESEPGAGDELLDELAYHYFECAWAGNAAKAVDYCRRAADQAMARLAYEGAADLYDRALHALEELDDELSDREDQQAELLVARCEALLAAGDVVSATGAVAQLRATAGDSARLAAWGTCFDGQLSMLTDPERLDEIESAVSAAAEKLAALDDAAGEAKAHTVRAGCLARLGRIGDCETALDQALTAARRAGEHRRVNAVLAGAPLAALWGPNPVPRAGGRCLDVVRLLRITTGSPVVEATSTRCQAVLDAFRGRAAEGRRLIDSARRTLTELGLRHALLEVDQFAGIVELIADDPGAAEPHLRRAYDGFRRMGMDADTADTAALLARACLALDRDEEADELCSKSERLAGHALKPSIAWRTVRAQLVARRGEYAEARRVAEEAVTIAERTDGLVDHGDACLALATVLDAAGDATGARAAAEKAAQLYDAKGAAALAEKARRIVGATLSPGVSDTEGPAVELDNACVRTLARLNHAAGREAWDEAEQLFASGVSVESHRRIVGYPRVDLPSGEYSYQMRHFLDTGMVRYQFVPIAVRGERLALTRLKVGTADLSFGAPQDEMLQVVGVDEECRVALQVVFDVDDMDAALAELDAAHVRLASQTPRRPLENAASRVEEQAYALFEDGRPQEIGALLADDHLNEDRRRGLRRASNDRDTAIENIRAIASLGVRITQTPLALRGDRLCLSHVLFEKRETQPEAFSVETLEIAEVDTDGRMVAKVVFDAEDFDAAIAELDARYLAGEAAPYAHTWSTVAGVYASLNRRELPPTTADCVGIDRRRLATIEPGDMATYLRATWDAIATGSVYVKAVHRLSDVGAVVTHAAYGTSQQGFDAEWQVTAILTFDGELISGCELFDESAVDSALARFDELGRPKPSLENAATRFYERLNACFASGDWAAFGDLLAAEVMSDDRRPVVNAGLQRGREAVIAEVSAITDVGLQGLMPNTIAIRGEYLALSRVRSLSKDPQDGAFYAEVIDVIELDTDERILARIVFDSGDLDAAFEELDARYLAGEAAAHARTWSSVAEAFAAVARHELPTTKPDWAFVDHRRGTPLAGSDLTAVLSTVRDVTPDASNRIETVHRLSNFGAVATQVSYGTSQEGFGAEWRLINLMMVEGDLLSRCELFDETDLDVALARFEELSRPARRLDNAASRVSDRLFEHFASRDWAAMADILAADFHGYDRRQVMNVDLHGRDAVIESFRAAAEFGIPYAFSPTIAKRGERLVLSRVRYSISDEDPDAYRVELLQIVEVDGDERIAGLVTFDVEDIDAAFEELDARYLAGEAAAYAHTWSLVAGAYRALNQREMPPTTRDHVSIDHRRVVFFEPGDIKAYTSSAWNQIPDLSFRIETVHRLNNHGAVVTHALRGTSQDGFGAEWREIHMMTIDGDLFNRSEMYDEDDLDVAVARFDELSTSTPMLENDAIRARTSMAAAFNRRDLNAFLAHMAVDGCYEDRRKGLRDYGSARREAVQGVFDAPKSWRLELEPVAIRGHFLGLTRERYRDAGLPDRPVTAESLTLTAIDDSNSVVKTVFFDANDFDTAIEVLDADYLVGEAAACAHTWSVVAEAYAKFNLREVSATTPDWANIDHRRGAAFAPGDMIAYLKAAWDDSPDTKIHIAAVHRLSKIGAIVTHVAHGISQTGFDAEWRDIHVLTVEGDMVGRSEIFDEADLEAALARFDELNRQARLPENAATHTWARVADAFNRRDVDGLIALTNPDGHLDDRRTGVRDFQNGSMRQTVVQTLFEYPAGWRLEIDHVATRGLRLCLTRQTLRDTEEAHRPITMDLLTLLEVGEDGLALDFVNFDANDIDAAFAELDARYLAGEAASHAHTWSAIANANAAFNRREMPPTTPDWVNIDHRRGGMAFAPGDQSAYIRATWDVAPHISNRIVAVHRLSDAGAAFTQLVQATSREGFNGEWRDVVAMTVEGDMISRCEVFDEADLDDALAAFDERY